MKQYLALLRHIEENGITKTNERTGTGTKAVFGYQMRFNLSSGFPLLTTKEMFWKGLVYELLWMISGSRNIRPLVINNVNIWNEWPFQKWLEKTGIVNDHPKYSVQWHEKLREFVQKIKGDEQFAEKYGDLGSVYGYQWRHWKGRGTAEIDQLARVINLLRTNPDDRRMIITAWDPSVLEEVALPPCHLLMQFFVGNGRLSCQVYQRSVDTFLGLPFNIAEYALLVTLMAHVVGLDPGDLIMTLGDTHIYLNHLEQVKLQLEREPKELPFITINPAVKFITGCSIGDISLLGYHPHPKISAPISV